MKAIAFSVAMLAFAGEAQAALVDLAPTGTTTVTLDAGFVGVLTGAGIAPSATGTATLVGLDALFPITGGTLDTDTNNLRILHEGSGLQFQTASATVTAGNFIVDTALGLVLGDVTAPGGVAVNDADLFAIGPGLTLTLTNTAAGVFATAFGAEGLTGANVGTAATTPSPVPEPGTVLLMAAGLGGVALLRRRRAA